MRILKRREKKMEKKILIVLLAITTILSIDANLYGASTESPKLTLTWGTGATGGGFFTYGAAVANVIRRHSNLQITTQTTGGSNANAKLLASKQVDMINYSLGDPGIIKVAPNAVLLYAATPYSQQFAVPKDFPYRSITEMKGKRLTVPVPGTGGYTTSKDVLDGLGLTFDDFKTSFLSLVDQTQAYKDNKVDIIGQIAPMPTPSWMDLPKSPRGLKIIGLTEEEIVKVRAKYPEYVPMEIPAGIYEGIKESKKTVGLWFRLIATRDFPEAAAYWIAKVMHENYKEMVIGTAQAKMSTAQNTIQLSTVGKLKLHPGVARYFKEVGLLK
jgi:TRAP transporter TAXI family solute receptor